MNLHEYQGKEIFARYGIPVPEGLLAKSPEAARAAAKTLGGRVVAREVICFAGRQVEQQAMQWDPIEALLAATAPAPER